MEYEWHLKPGQLLNITFSDPRKQKTDKVVVPAIITEVHFSADIPEATVLYWNRWNTGGVGGSIKLRCPIHRYMTDIDEDTINFFKGIYKNDGEICGFNQSHGFDRAFYIDNKKEVIYPFGKEVELVE